MLGDSLQAYNRRLWAESDWLGRFDSRSSKQPVYRKGSFKEHARAVALAFLSSYVLDITAVSGYFSSSVVDQ